MSGRKPDLKRRNFLLTVGLGGAGAAAGALGGRALMNEPKAVPAPTAGGAGYHLSRHVQNYYRTARV